jgi:CheY-like chemotaxis protein
MDSSLGRTKILLVDDRPDKLLALRTMLEELDANLVCATSGAEALRQLLHDEFAVILLDVNMPGMDGFETAAMIRRRKRSETTPIIFISAVNDAETHVSRGYSLGAVDYILTPVVPEILRAKIAVFVDLYRKTEQIKRQAEEHAELIREQAARAEAEAGRVAAPSSPRRAMSCPARSTTARHSKTSRTSWCRSLRTSASSIVLRTTGGYRR